MTKVEAVNALVKTLPSLKLAFIGHKDLALIELLDQKLQSVDGELSAFIYDESLDILPTLRLKMMPNYTKYFRTVAREYEILILNDITFNIGDPEHLYKTAFKALENSADIFILEPKLNGIKELLEGAGFVAINEIDIDDTMQLITAKKMHGWGYGL